MKKLDPRTVLAVIVCLTTLSVLCLDIVYLGCVLAVSLIADAAFKVDLRGAFKRVRFLIPMIVFIALLQSLTVKSGTALVRLGRVNLITSGGLLSGTAFALRMSIIIFSALIALTRTSGELTDGLIKMKIPYEIAFMTAVALRFIPSFREEFVNRYNAILLRGIDIKELKLKQKIKLYAYLISPSVVGGILKSSYLADAMAARGFRAYKKRTMLRELKLTAADIFVMLFMFGLSAGFLIFMYINGGIL